MILYPRHMKYVQGYIVFIFPSVCPSFWDSLRPCFRMLTFYVKVLREVFCFSYISESLPFWLFTFDYRIYPKYSDTRNIRTPSFFLKRHLFYVPYISGHVPYRVFLLSVNVRTPKTCPLFLIKLLFFTT